MTMSKSHWSVAETKSRLSEVLENAQNFPQVIEKRGAPLAVIVSIASYNSTIGALDESSTRAAAWEKFLLSSKKLRESGGFDLVISKRQSRPDPFRSPRSRKP